jgi:hypothetical protein
VAIDKQRVVETANVFADELVRHHGEGAQLEVLVVCAQVRGGRPAYAGEPAWAVGLGGNATAVRLLREVVSAIERRTEERWYPDIREEGVEEGP